MLKEKTAREKYAEAIARYEESKRNYNSNCIVGAVAIATLGALFLLLMIANSPGFIQP